VTVARRSHHPIAEDEPDVVVAAIGDVLDASDGEPW